MGRGVIGMKVYVVDCGDPEIFGMFNYQNINIMSKEFKAAAKRQSTSVYAGGVYDLAEFEYAINSEDLDLSNSYILFGGR